MNDADRYMDEDLLDVPGEYICLSDPFIQFFVNFVNNQSG